MTIMLIDGDCELCHGVTRFVILRDRRERIRFGTLQSKAGQRLLREGGMPLDDRNTFVMIQDGVYYTKSEAAIRALRMLDGPWSAIALAAILVPRCVRERIYEGIAARRYGWFGQRESCLLRAEATVGRFIHDEEEEQANLC
ncbi:thiol-disulfide oxidoreductase DCC family protein [Paenibacillus sp. GCM10023252]|uniref:thiol-disulfide oxidoreductase DCC family protein n=1 Tax=Paenibacillus sp. GCM10023252 TaxID=3252649 RepID=UPI00360AB438